jgi:hypothetical protein
LSFFFLLKEKRNKKVQGKPDRSARFAGPTPPHCLMCIFYFEVDDLANNGACVTGWIQLRRVGLPSA